eukprot:8991363-Pyramimonas_sp.AAC.3
MRHGARRTFMCKHGRRYFFYKYDEHVVERLGSPEVGTREGAGGAFGCGTRRPCMWAAAAGTRPTRARAPSVYSRRWRSSPRWPYSAAAAQSCSGEAPICPRTQITTNNK